MSDPVEIAAKAIKASCPREDMHPDVAFHMALTTLRALEQSGFILLIPAHPASGGSKGRVG